MEPLTVEVVAAALTAGASAGLTTVASTTITDAYTSLRDAVQRRLGRHVQALNNAGADDPATLETELVEELTGTSIELDPDVVAAVRSLLDVITETRSDGGAKYAVDVRGGKAVQVGDGNIQNIDTVN